MRTLKSQLSEIDHLKVELNKANNKIQTADVVHYLITGTQQETEELLKEGRSMNELATMVTTLKRELINNNNKRAQVVSNANELKKQLQLCKNEKS